MVNSDEVTCNTSRCLSTGLINYRITTQDHRQRLRLHVYEFTASDPVLFREGDATRGQVTHDNRKFTTELFRYTRRRFHQCANNHQQKRLAFTDAGDCPRYRLGPRV